MNRNFFIAVSVVLIFIIGVYLYRLRFTQQPPSPQQRHDVSSITPTAAPTVTAIYTGTLPCADCEGIDAVLTLYDNETYVMTNTYLGKDTKPYEEKGKWTILRGDATDPDATVYQLYDQEGQSGNNENYVLKEDKLIPLDDTLHVIESPFDMSLTKQAS